MPLCPVFTQRIAEFEAALLQARELLEEYGRSGEPELVRQIKEDMTALQEERRTFVNGEYFDAVKQLLTAWMPDDTSTEEVPFTLDAQGRIIGSKDAKTLQLWSNSGRRPSCNTSYFPHLIRQMGSHLTFARDDYRPNADSFPSAQEFDFLEGVYGNLEIGEKHRSFHNLKTVGRGLYVGKNNRMHFPALEEVGGMITLPPGLEDFTAMFPNLRRVGRGSDLGYSFLLSPPSLLWHMQCAQRVKEQIERLQAEGKLQFEGTIRVG